MFREFHTKLLHTFQRTFKVSNYGMLWISFGEGVFFGLLIINWIFGIFLFLFTKRFMKIEFKKNKLNN